jgi:hypothetical protein
MSIVKNGKSMFIFFKLTVGAVVVFTWDVMMEPAGVSLGAGTRCKKKKIIKLILKKMIAVPVNTPR